MLPWLKGKDHERLQTTRDYLRLAFDRIPIAVDKRDPITRIAQKALSLPARWRLDNDVYKLPVELWLNRKLNERLGLARSKPVVDAKLLASTRAEVAC